MLNTPAIVFAAEKGGVGKTTLAVNVASAYAESGARTLIVDMDPQGNATAAFGIDHAAAPGAAALLNSRPLPLSECVVEARAGLWLAPSERSALQVEGADLHRRPGGDRALARALSKAGDLFDVIVIDTPPALDALTLNAVAAGTVVVGVLEPSKRSLEGVLVVEDFVRLAREEWEIGTAVFAGAVYNSVERTVVAAAVRAAAADHGLAILVEVPRRVVVREAEHIGEPLMFADPDCEVAHAIRDLAGHLLQQARTLDLSESCATVTAGVR